MALAPSAVYFVSCISTPLLIWNVSFSPTLRSLIFLPLASSSSSIIYCNVLSLFSSRFKHGRFFALSQDEPLDFFLSVYQWMNLLELFRRGWWWIRGTRQGGINYSLHLSFLPLRLRMLIAQHNLVIGRSLSRLIRCRAFCRSSQIRWINCMVGYFWQLLIKSLEWKRIQISCWPATHWKPFYIHS